MTATSSRRDNGEVVINSGGRLTIEYAADFRRLLLDGLEASRNVSVEFEAGVEIDMTGIHLLCSACKTAAAGGKTFSCRGPRPLALADLLEASGVGRNAACSHHPDSGCFLGGTI